MRTIRRRLLPGLLCASLFASAGFCLPASAQSTAPNEWTWMGGSNSTGSSGGQPGVYGSLGAPAAGNIPGGRYYAATWTDASGNFWLFGGTAGYSAPLTGSFTGDEFNDLWEFNPTTSEWAWMGGSNTLSCSGQYCYRPGVYGSLQVPSKGNIPGSRYGSATWVDKNGNFWLFGGYGYDANGQAGYLNDLWEFKPSTLEWAWMGGVSTVPVQSNGYGSWPAVYGTQGTPSATNTPGSRTTPITWVDKNGDFWLFGGQAWVNSVSDFVLYDDLWQFNPSTNEWTWIWGSSAALTGTGQPPDYVVSGAPSPLNDPGGHASASSWTDSNGNLWLYGGAANLFDGASADLWEFDVSLNQWAWIGGPQRYSYPPIEYGTLGVPNPGVTPGIRVGAASWTDPSGNLWLFGGDDQAGTSNIWVYTQPTNEWIWMGGDGVSAPFCQGSCSGRPGVYGSLGTPSEGNMPGYRSYAASWTDRTGNFWLFGGNGEDGTGGGGNLNDLWEYQPSTTPHFTQTVTPILSPGTGNYSANQLVTITDSAPGAAIYYSITGSAQATASTLYSGPIQVSATETISAVAVANNYSNSAVASATYTFAQPDFSIAASPVSMSVTGGQSGTTSVSITPIDGFNSTVSLACSGLPTTASWSCSLSPPTVTPSGAAASTTLTVTTSLTSATLHRKINRLFPASEFAATLCCLCCLGWKKRRRFQALLLLAVSAAGLSLFTACSGGGSGSGGTGGTGGSGGSPHQPVTATITVLATSGSISHSTTFTVTAN